MTDVLIRDLPAADLDALRAAAAAEGSSLQAYLRAALRAHAAVPSPPSRLLKGSLHQGISPSRCFRPSP
ncbi:MAG: hypothetical protein V9F04_12600 [Dermatophilaceae bacterium]